MTKFLKLFSLSLVLMASFLVGPMSFAEDAPTTGESTSQTQKVGDEGNDAEIEERRKDTSSFNVMEIFRIGSDDEPTENNTQRFIEDARERGISPVAAVILRVINILSLIIGTFAFIMILIGGFMFVGSGGEESQIERAKSIISQAVVGLIIGLSAYLIVSFVASFLF